jgi:hypothetical protein
MNRFLRTPQLQISPLRLHSVSTVHLQPNNHDIFARKLSIKLPRTNLHSASSVHIPNSTSIFSNIPMVKLNRLNSRTLNRYNIKLPSPNLLNSGRKFFPSISKCNRKRCCTCKYISCDSVIKSTTNGRNFSVSIPSDIS